MEPGDTIQPSRKMRKWLLCYVPLGLTAILTVTLGCDHDPQDGLLELALQRLTIAGLSFVLAMIVCLGLFHLLDLLSAAFRKK